MTQITYSVIPAVVGGNLVYIRAPLKTPSVILNEVKDPVSTVDLTGFFATLRMTKEWFHRFIEVPIIEIPDYCLGDDRTIYPFNF